MKLLPILSTCAGALVFSTDRWRDLRCSGLVGGPCASWMRCYNNGMYSKNDTKLGCKAAGLHFNGNACWARVLNGRLFGGIQNCPQLAKKHCPRNYVIYYKCLTD
ncbi:hypothetical protein DSO57_1007142 [Entomophthora muscae]|uniref:Uncharacterized protein n=2 Tax=Entomophthora muscae TaxID=34485 RepID=A0ACC2T7F7_9FUNG|nr:hypothetical protein DSO57_1003169 [Entomophthora muscae]KAJ9070518.1 hypothetical protein DSO57_1007142 [Entomophthora muscae]